MAKQTNTPKSKPQATPASKKIIEKKQEEEDSEDDADDMEEMKTLTSVGKTPAKKADPEDEDDGEDEEENDEEEDDDDHVFDVFSNLVGNQVGITIPPRGSVHVVGVELEGNSYPLQLTSACLGPDAEPNDRATLVASFIDFEGHEHENDDDEEEEDDDEEEGDLEEGLKEIVVGTLVHTYCENISLSLVTEGTFILTNTSEETPIYVTGRIDPNPRDDDDEDYFDDEDDEDDEEIEEEEAETQEFSEEEEEEDKKVVEERTKSMRKRLLETSENGNATPSSKKVKSETPASTTPKVLDVKSESKKPASGAKPTEEEVLKFLLSELKTKKTIKLTDAGQLISNKFATGFKNLGFEHKNIQKFLEVKAKGKVAVAQDAIKLIE